MNDQHIKPLRNKNQINQQSPFNAANRSPENPKASIGPKSPAGPLKQWFQDSNVFVFGLWPNVWSFWNESLCFLTKKNLPIRPKNVQPKKRYQKQKIVITREVYDQKKRSLQLRKKSLLTKEKKITPHPTMWRALHVGVEIDQVRFCKAWVWPILKF